MHVRGGSQWKQQRAENPISTGPLRRAHPASGATWNVQVVRGKMSTQCLWHACRALIVGILLMIIGASMATIGYYSNDFALGEYRNNTTIRVKKEQRGLHLNNLSYMGPIIMGVGGFIVVASCVMTFEARDSAAKVVPARFKLNSSRNRSGAGSRRTTSVQSSDSRKTSTGHAGGRWDIGLYKSSPIDELPADRHALTAALIHFSRTLGSPKYAPPASTSSPSFTNRRISKSGSVPNLGQKEQLSPLLKGSGSPGQRISKQQHHNHHHHKHQSIVHRQSRENGYLHPGMLRFHRHAISVDETTPLRPINDSAHGSQCSVTFDPKLEIIDIEPVHKRREPVKRSDTSRRHVLSRQKPIEKDEPHGSPKPARYLDDSRRKSTTMSEQSFSSRRAGRSRRASSASRTLSFESHGNHNQSVSSTVGIDDLLHSPERHNSPRKENLLLSTPSMERECRSQLSICSEPMVAAARQLSCQSSLEPCVPEEDSPVMEKENFQTSHSIQATIEHQQRPDSLILNTHTIEDSSKPSDAKKYLYRSQSTRSFKKPKPSKLISNDLDQIYVISSSCVRADLDDFYDSIEVIHERRSKNFSKFNEGYASEPEKSGNPDEVAIDVGGNE